jgi:hypothetical protein
MIWSKSGRWSRAQAASSSVGMATISMSQASPLACWLVRQPGGRLVLQRPFEVLAAIDAVR